MQAAPLSTARGQRQEARAIPDSTGASALQHTTLHSNVDSPGEGQKSVHKPNTVGRGLLPRPFYYQKIASLCFRALARKSSSAQGQVRVLGKPSEHNAVLLPSAGKEMGMALRILATGPQIVLQTPSKRLVVWEVRLL